MRLPRPRAKSGLPQGIAALAALAVGLALLAGAGSPLGAGPAFFPVAAVRPGMTGTGRTVVLGTRVVEFGVRVLGVLKNAGPAGDLVLFRAFGPALEKVGGLAAGMSGSPIYLEGRLAGAFSYAFEGADPFVGLFTPIEDMLRDLPAPQEGGRGDRAVPVSPFRLGGRWVREVIIAPRPGAAPPPGTAVAVPAATPLFVSGLAPLQQERLARLVAPMGLVAIPGSGPVHLPPSVPLVPGSAIGVGLIRGEISAYAIGTLTYRDGARVLAFGHPLANLGRTSYVLTNATIFQTLKSASRNIAVGAAGVPVGVVTEDRPAAIGGVVGVLPRVFGVEVRVRDADTGASHRYVFQVVRSRELAPALVTLSVEGAIQRALNRSGEGTARVRMVLRGRALPHPVVRENLFYSGSDITVDALSELPEALHLLFDNDFTDVRPSDMVVDVRVTRDRKTALITGMDAPSGPLVPGHRVQLAVHLRPFRGEPESRTVDFLVPQGTSPGPALLVARAGGAGAASRLPGGLALASPAAPPAHTLEEAIASFEDGERNTDVVVELVGAQAGESPAAAAAGEPHRATARVTTPWVVRGRVQVPVRIEGGTR
jgi:hypothetical protein